MKIQTISNICSEREILNMNIPIETIEISSSNSEKAAPEPVGPTPTSSLRVHTGLTMDESESGGRFDMPKAINEAGF